MSADGEFALVESEGEEEKKEGEERVRQRKGKGEKTDGEETGLTVFTFSIPIIAGFVVWL